MKKTFDDAKCEGVIYCELYGLNEDAHTQRNKLLY